MNENLEVLLPYQKVWIEDESKQKICEKGRRVGLSYAEALNSVLKAAPEKRHINTYYLSYNKDMTRQFIEDCAFWAKQLDIAVSDIVCENLIDDENRDILIYRITFSSGAEIVALPSTAYSLRSKQGRVVFDEAAFCDDFDGVLKAAQALLIWGGQFSIISTHNGEDSAFNALLEETRRNKEDKWSIHTIPFRLAVEEGLYKRICLLKGKQWTQQAEDKWLAEIYDVYKDNAIEELDVIPSKGGKKFFGRGLLNSVRDRTIKIIRWEFADEFLFSGEDSKTQRITELFEADVVPVLKSCSGTFSFGMDFARSGDLSVIWGAEELGKSLMTRFILEIKNCPFAQQETAVKLLLDYCKKTHRLTGLAIDARGNGQHLAENISVEFAGYAMGVMETAGWYGEWFPKTKALLESADLTVPDDEAILSDFSIVVLKNGIPTIPAVKTDDRDKKNKRHGDGVAACALMVYARSECGTDPAPDYAETERERAKLFAGY